jgi:hypothetical protein
VLADVQPKVWRRLLIPGGVRLDKLHRILQAAMGWEDRHLHTFFIGGVRFGEPFDDGDGFDGEESEIDERGVTLAEVLGDHELFAYEYDLGDGWLHEIAVHGVRMFPRGLKFAVCLDGANACPPEDVGGPDGYEHLLAVLADPAHEEFGELSDWCDGPIDPTAFDLAAVNARLQALS